ncbi:MAG: hypothetical protein J6W82_05085 [Bacteroidales bacterium]|nr:hypothetical protein [Bacteroidales bacterium]
MYELPPILQGTEREQLVVLRDYLVRLSRSLDDSITKVVDTAVEASAKRVQTKQATEQADTLRGLIVKTADTIHHEIDMITQELHEDYVAVSDFGTYRESVTAEIQTTARQTVESYGYTSAIETLNTQLGTVEDYMESIQGEIVRGYIEDPVTHETGIGIAISEQLSFTGTTQDQGGVTYYELTPGQSLGLYTSTGWQFWLNGKKVGWFDSRDEMLHTVQLAVEQDITLGAGWIMTPTNGFGLRYVGS